MRSLLLAAFIAAFVGGGTSFADCQSNQLLFDLTGPTCSSTNQLSSCQCSEGMRWGPVNGATYYQIQRKQLPSGPVAIVGDTRWRNHLSFVDDDGVTWPAIEPTDWYFAWDCQAGGCFFPQPGISYEYTVKGCKPGVPAGTTDICAVNWSNTVTYTGAPYYCYNNGTKVLC